MTEHLLCSFFVDESKYLIMFFEDILASGTLRKMIETFTEACNNLLEYLTHL